MEDQLLRERTHVREAVYTPLVSAPRRKTMLANKEMRAALRRMLSANPKGLTNEEGQTMEQSREYWRIARTTELPMERACHGTIKWSL